MSYNSISFALKQDDVVGFTDIQRNSVELQASISIFAEPPIIYKSFKYPRFKSFYGYAQIMSGAFVIESIELCYLNQQVLHWQHSATDINQSLGCGIKKVLAALPTPVTATVKVATLRQIFTSIRFKFVPGAAANFNLTWHFPERLCDEDLVLPPEDQGNPPAANNGGGSPSTRPSDQGGDPKDNSPNDGQNPAPGEDPPPGSGGGGSNPTWKVVVTGYRKDNSAYTATFNTGITARSPIPSITTRGLSDAPNDAGKGASVIVVNGQDTDARGWGLNIFAPGYY